MKRTIELLVVISLITIVASVATAQYWNWVSYSREAVFKGNLFKARDAIDRYYADKSKYLMSRPGLSAK